MNYGILASAFLAPGFEVSSAFVEYLRMLLRGQRMLGDFAKARVQFPEIPA